MLRERPSILRNAVRFNMEADSLNCSILGPDAAPGTDEFDLFVKEVLREMTSKAGQKCTAIRRAMVPRAVAGAVADALAARIAKTVVGNPRNETVTMGPIVDKSQQKNVLDGLAALKREAKAVTGEGAFTPLDADPAKSAFVSASASEIRRPQP